MSELLEPLATEAGQQEIVRAIRDIGSLENAVRAEQAAALASTKAGEAVQSALEASEAENKAKDWATKTDGYVEQETITTPPEQEGEEPTTETINLYSARYYAALAQDIFNNMSFDSVPIENSNALLTSGVVYDALDLKADKSTTYTKTEVDTALSNVQGQLTFDNVPTANSDNPVKSSGIKTALDSKQDTLTFDNTPTANSTNPVTSGGIYTALQNVDANIEVDDEITEDSDNPVTSAAIYEALQNFTPSGGGGGAGNASGMIREELWSGSWSSGSITLSNSIATYDLIEIIYHSTGGGRTQNYSRFISSQDLLKYTSESSHTAIYGIGDSYYDFYVQTPNVLVRNSYEGRNYIITEIYGIKFSKNLSEQMYSNVLYENSSGWSSGNITLNDAIENYDFIEFIYGEESYNLQRYSMTFNKEEISDYINNSRRIVLDGAGTRYFMFSLFSNTQFNFISRDTNVVYKIIGHKMAKGSYSGIVSDARMTVKSGTIEATSTLGGDSGQSISVTFDSPMPDDSYVVSFTNLSEGAYCSTLTTLMQSQTASGFTVWIHNNGGGTTAQKPKFNWIAIRPNSYTREGMVEDVLFSNASGVNSGTINLSGNISDYDLIQFKWRADSHTGTNEKYGSNIVLCSLLQEHIGKKYELDAWNERFIGFYITSDNSFTVDTKSELSIFKITGIKFGRYVSGVAVDTTVTQNSDAVVTSGAVYDALQNIPSGGGSGSITIDSVPTENSQNAVSSGGVYDALQNLPSGGGSVDVYDLKTPVINGYNIKSANSAYYVAEKGKLVCPTNVYTHTDIPSLYAVFRADNNGMRPILICPIREGATVSRRSDGSGIDSNNNTYKQYYDQDREITWYCVTDVNMLYGWNEVLDSAIANNIPLLEDCRDWLSACKKLIQLAEPVIETRTVKENLFSPTNFTLSSGDTISSDTLKALIAYPRPIVVNNETYYFVKKENGTSYYENPNNTITINSSWVVTITAKSSGGSSITVDSTITQGGTNPVEGGAIYDGLSELGSGLTSLSQAMLNKQDRLTFDTTPTADSSNPVTSGGVYTALQNLPTGSGDVTTNTDQNITGTKTFVGSKKVGFKQSTANDKLGFTLYGNTGTERGYLEFNPTNTVDGVAGLMTLGNYATSAAGLTQVGFRRYSNISGASGAYNLLMPMVADAKTPFSLTTSYQNFYLPLGFTDGTTTVRTAKSGLVDLSPLLASLEARIAALEGN